jgi:hypothetical protein
VSPATSTIYHLTANGTGRTLDVTVQVTVREMLGQFGLAGYQPLQILFSCYADMFRCCDDGSVMPHSSHILHLLLAHGPTLVSD